MRQLGVLGTLTVLLGMMGCQGDVDDVRRLHEQRSREYDERRAAAQRADAGGSDAPEAPAVGLDAPIPEASLEDRAMPEVEGAADTRQPDAADAGCDLLQTAPRERAIFVASRGSGAGTPEAPFPTIGAALVAAEVTGVTTIYVDPGVYEEDPIVVSRDITIRGDFWRSDGVWRKQCSPSRPRIRVRSVSTGPNVGVRVRGGSVVLLALEIETAKGITLVSGEGQSTFGVWASAGTLQIIDTRIETGPGGDGAQVSGTLPATPHVCDGLEGCTSQNDAPGGAGRVGEHGKAGRFTSEGFKPQPPGAGAQGEPGKNGILGMDGDGDECVTSCSTGARCVCQTTRSWKLGGTGTCGCGGTGGAPGKPGNPGGASVAVFMTPGSALSLQSAELVAGSGGAGTDGSEGAEGSPGDEGTKGADTECYANCNGPGGACTQGSLCQPGGVSVLAGGAAGGRGGRGGHGGKGGAAFGGPSYALVAHKDVVVLGIESSSLTASRGGAGGVDGLRGATASTAIVEW